MRNPVLFTLFVSLFTISNAQIKMTGPATMPAKNSEITYHGEVLEVDLSSLDMKKAHSVLISLHSTVELDDLEVIITNDDGTVVDDHEFHHTSAEHYMLNTDLLKHGTYHYDILVDHQTFRHGTIVI